MREGNYDDLTGSGPPEIRKGAEEANELARTLDRLSHDNRNLLRKIVSLQDDERQDLARELHDELGPLLFGIRANAVALLEACHPKSGPRTSAQASCSRPKRCSKPTAASWIVSGRSISRNWASREASKRCCKTPGRRRRRSSCPRASIAA